jgi:deoxyhypusine synthase
MGNIFASYVIKGDLKVSTMKSGIEYMTFQIGILKILLTGWIFQIGGGIAEISQFVWFQCCTKIWKPETP